MYCKMRMGELTDSGIAKAMSFAERSQVIGKEWRTMSEEAKAPFQRLYEELIRAYLGEGVRICNSSG